MSRSAVCGSRRRATRRFAYLPLAAMEDDGVAPVVLPASTLSVFASIDLAGSECDTKKYIKPYQILPPINY